MRQCGSSKDPELQPLMELHNALVAVHDAYFKERRYFTPTASSVLMSLPECPPQVWHTDYDPMEMLDLQVLPLSAWTTFNKGGSQIGVLDGFGIEQSPTLCELPPSQPCPLPICLTPTPPCGADPSDVAFIGAKCIHRGEYSSRLGFRFHTYGESRMDGVEGAVQSVQQSGALYQPQPHAMEGGGVSS